MIKKVLGKVYRRIKYAVLGQQVPCLIPYKPNGSLRAVHISAFSYGNAGDTLLPVVLRSLFNNCIGVKKWIGRFVYKTVNPKDIRTYNHNDFVVIGGGGLFLKDTNPNNLSGWQWSCGIKELEAIKKPIIGFAIGYNRFRGQDDFEPIFTEHLNKFVEKAVFVGIRNHGSIEHLKQYLKTGELKSKLTYQPCMTTLISHIYPDFVNYLQKDDFIAFNCAFDREKLRSGNDQYLKEIANVALQMSKYTKIKYFSHMSSDNKALPYFDSVGVPYELVEFKNIQQIVNEYSKARVVAGMRGHAQMIPFGCLTPIFSIISHDKLQWFLDDIEHHDWGVDVSDAEFGNKLYENLKNIYDNYERFVSEIKKQQDRLWNLTMENMKSIQEIILSFKS